MTRLLIYFADMLVCTLPPRYRKWRSQEDSGFRGPAITSGIVQFLLFMFLSVVNYVNFFQRGVGSLGKLLIDAGAEEALTAGTVQYGLGVVTTGQYLIHPASILLFYMAFEGIIRALSALVSGQILPTLPLAAVAFVHNRVDAWRAERVLGPVMADEIQKADGTEYDLRILSSRPKPDWNRYITVQYQDVFYQMFREEQGPPPRRFIYYLRKNPIGRLVVVIRHYPPPAGAKS